MLVYVDPELPRGQVLDLEGDHVVHGLPHEGEGHLIPELWGAQLIGLPEGQRYHLEVDLGIPQPAVGVLSVYFQRVFPKGQPIKLLVSPLTRFDRLPAVQYVGGPVEW